MMINLLSEMGRSGPTRRLRRTDLVKRGARRWLRREVLDGVSDRRNDVTVLIGIRNRSDHRLVNALCAIKNQVLPMGSVHAVVVDYGSAPLEAARAAAVCADLGAGYIRIEASGPWSRGRCLNIGIRRAETKYVLTSDVDVVFSPGYVADAVAALEAAPLSVVVAPMWDLPEESADTFRRAAETQERIDLDYWKKHSTPRFGIDSHPSVTMTYTVFYHLIRGYDEYFEVWGGEDRDLMERLTNVGLVPVPLETDSFYLHQWHPKFEGVDAGENAPEIRRNRKYFADHHSILRNDASWGRGLHNAPVDMPQHR